MKNQIYVSGLFISILLTFTAQAQLSIGLKGGVNITSVSTDDGYNTAGIKNTFGGHAGIMLEIASGEHWAVQPEINWLQKGYLFDNGTVETRWIFNELDLHLLGKYKFNLGAVKSYLNAGPTFGKVMSGFKKPSNGTKIDLDFDKDQINAWDYGITAGLGLGLSLGKGVVFVDGRYMLSLNDIFTEAANKGKFRKVGFDYTLGYFFPLN